MIPVLPDRLAGDRTAAEPSQAGSDVRPGGGATPSRPHSGAPEPAWLTTAEAAARIRRHKVTVLRAFNAGRLHGHQTMRGGRVLFTPAAVDAFAKGGDSAQACGCDQLARRRRRAS